MFRLEDYSREQLKSAVFQTGGTPVEPADFCYIEDLTLGDDADTWDEAVKTNDYTMTLVSHLTDRSWDLSPTEEGHRQFPNLKLPQFGDTVTQYLRQTRNGGTWEATNRGMGTRDNIYQNTAEKTKPPYHPSEARIIEREYTVGSAIARTHSIRYDRDQLDCTFTGRGSVEQAVAAIDDGSFVAVDVDTAVRLKGEVVDIAGDYELPGDENRVHPDTDRLGESFIGIIDLPDTTATLEYKEGDLIVSNWSHPDLDGSGPHPVTGLNTSTNMEWRDPDWFSRLHRYIDTEVAEEAAGEVATVFTAPQNPYYALGVDVDMTYRSQPTNDFPDVDHPNNLARAANEDTIAGGISAVPELTVVGEKMY
ncbi:hypothetical protein RYH80_17890 [Halobaculum sp. MBLA0147]|uniref:hypothetical protein n=1 Tax=Halobaculum sp. MBLA0147 TaxID=3079934 RepID=UPI00352678D0